ncbi:hypothetical protein BV25DRAFT_1023096 [Artomyces pyxidatus]|uniref:Uncharacterized protein n=1 Tax=Artomyces pyxidatus TaxID=48021 RepID=A0ACB8STL2_9AGAM|nr:hypothetical protein BV25DRAFT_1023096 [Artomyces pyxidatus]
MLILLLFACTFFLHFVLGSPMASLTTSTPTNGSSFLDFSLATTSAADTCKDIDICRTRNTIIWSSLLTIFACVWTAIHRNVPAPQAGESRLWRIVGRVWEAAKIVVVTVMVPEWVLAWAVRQFLNARHVRYKLEEARGQAEGKWTEKRGKLRGVKPVLTEGDDQSAEGTRYEALPLLEAKNDPQSTSNHARESVEKSKVSEELAFDGKLVVAANKQIGRLDSSKWDNVKPECCSPMCSVSEYTLRHGFFVVMGGFHYYKDGRPQHPLTPGDVVKLVKSGDLTLPTDEEIGNLSQSDVLSKTIAILQTLWFVVQAIARGVEGLPITQLEIMTLAYTTITVAMYAVWWDKPQNVGGPVRVAVKELPEPEKVGEGTWYMHIFYAIAGIQDDRVDLRKAQRVPTFYGGGASLNAGVADVIALVAAMVFGAVHCAAWHCVFPSHTETLIWRISSLAIVALPATILASLLYYTMKIPGNMFEAVFAIVFGLVFVTSPPLYLAARALLLSLSFSTLWSLPPEAYRAVQWTLRIPHFT